VAADPDFVDVGKIDGLLDFRVLAAAATADL
jgi:hypothetical protein